MTTVRQLSFAAGEISPSLYARVDLVKYSTGLRTMRNCFVMRHGGATNRPGTEFIGETKDSTKVARLIPFVYDTSVNSTNNFMLEFGHQYIRFIKNGTYISDLSLTITAISKANPGVVTYTGTDPSNGDHVDISGVLGMIEVNNRRFKVANVNAGANTFELNTLAGANVNTSSYTTYSSGGTAARVYTLTTTYDAADINALELKYVQSGNIVTITHNGYAPRELTRVSDSSWTLSTISFTPSISAPTGGSGSPVGSFDQYKVTAVKDETFEESLPGSAINGGLATPTPSGPTTISGWSTPTGTREFNVYKNLNDIYGFLGIAGSNSFEDIGVTPDITDTPPDSRNPFSGSSNWPATAAYIQQRLFFANTTSNTEKIWGSRIGFFHNFTISTPIQADDSVTFTMASRYVNKVNHILDLRGMVVLTDSGEFSIRGDASGVITPADINTQPHGYSGSSPLAPLLIGSTALFVQARGSIVRDLFFDFSSDGYVGKDLTIFSSHLIDDFDIVDWAYQQIPHSIVWAVRDDGTMIGLTYVREHDLWGWHRHDTDGVIENVATVPEGGEDALYMVVKRTINGSDVRYVERMHTRLLVDIVDSVFVDCSLTYDGTNSSATTMTLSGGTNWTYDETLTLTASASYFASTDVGKAIHITGTDGAVIRCEIVGFTNDTVVTVQPHMTVPVAMRSTAFTTWSLAINTVTGLWHLEGENVSVFADGFVVASPNNASISTLTVANGSITLNDNYAVIHVGLPYLSDIETLDIDTAQGETLVDKFKNISQVSMHVEESRGMWLGAEPPTDDDSDPLEGLTEIKIRNTEAYDEPVDLATGVVGVNIRPEWNSNGRVFIRQVDPVPMSILAIAPAGLLPFQTRGGG